MAEAATHSSKQIGDWGEHWVALRLLERGWRVKFLGDAVPSYDMIAYNKDHGGRTIQVKTIARNTAAIDLGPMDTFTADVLVFVVAPMGPDTTAYVYPGFQVREAKSSHQARGPFAVDRNPKRQTGKIHVWTRGNTKTETRFPTPENREAWELIALSR